MIFWTSVDCCSQYPQWGAQSRANAFCPILHMAEVTLTKQNMKKIDKKLQSRDFVAFPSIFLMMGSQRYQKEYN